MTTPTMRRWCSCRQWCLQLLWTISGCCDAIGLSYGPIGIVRWLGSGGDKEEGSQKIDGAEAILGSHQKGILLRWWELLGVVAKFVYATAGRMPSHLLSLRGARVEGSRGTRWIGKVSRLIVKLGSRGWPQKKMHVGWELITLPKRMMRGQC